MAESKTIHNIPPVEQLRGRTLGRILIKMGVLTRDKVHECLVVQKKGGGKVRIGEIFLEAGLVEESQLKIALAAQKGIEYVNISGLEIPEDVIKQVPTQTANAYRVVPLSFDSNSSQMVVALDDPDNFRAVDDLSTLTGYKVIAKIADPDALDAALERYYSDEKEQGEINELLGELQGDAFLAEFGG